MRKPPERVLLFRSGRHLRTALDALEAASPGCQVTVVATPPAVPLLDQMGIAADRRLIYERTPFFGAWPFLTSPAGAWVRRRRFDRVCVLWNDPNGTGQANVDRTAMLVSPRGFTAITADGSLIVRRTVPLLAREASRAAASLGVAALLGACLFLPARLLRPFRS